MYRLLIRALIFSVVCATITRADSLIRQKLAFLPEQQLTELDKVCNHVYVLAVKPTYFRPVKMWITDSVRKNYEQQVVDEFLAKRKKFMIQDGIGVSDANDQALKHSKEAQFARLNAYGHRADLNAINDKRLHVYRELFNKDLTAFQTLKSKVMEQEVLDDLDDYLNKHKPQGQIYDLCHYKSREGAFQARFGNHVLMSCLKTNLMQNYVASANLRTYEEQDYLERKKLISQTTPATAKEKMQQKLGAQGDAIALLIEFLSISCL